MTEIVRKSQLQVVRRLLREHPVVALLGARQVGKTTLANRIAQTSRGQVTKFDLEDSRDVALLNDPMLALEPLRGLVILDEIQRRPDLFPTIRVLADRRPRRARFLVLGSASPELLRQGSESLAGRIAFHELSGFTLAEVGAANFNRLWRRGGFPRSYLAGSEAMSAAWRRDFIRTFVERDLPGFGVQVPGETMGRFWAMLAHYHAGIMNASELGRSLGVAHTTIRRYLDLLESTFVVRVLRPWFANIDKRQVKSPKVYIADSGLLHALFDLTTQRDIERHPRVGASWEGFMLETVVRHLGARREQCFFWATHSGAGLDLLVADGRRRRGFEFKRTVSPGVTPSMHIAMENLGLKRLDVIHAGDRTFQMTKQIRAVSAARVLEDL